MLLLLGLYHCFQFIPHSSTLKFLSHGCSTLNLAWLFHGLHMKTPRSEKLYINKQGTIPGYKDCRLSNLQERSNDFYGVNGYYMAYCNYMVTIWYFKIISYVLCDLKDTLLLLSIPYIYDHFGGCPYSIDCFLGGFILKTICHDKSMGKNPPVFSPS